ncbi:MAG: DUF1501 domain-containing protein [Phycisphaerales bacterium]|nr:DUF1501 domain-containing protein [Phycisphaerales bacterium]
MLDVHGMLTFGDGDVAGALWQTGGRLHPVLVHFPLALVALAAGAEVLSAVAGRRGGVGRGLGMMMRGPSALARGCLVVGAPAAGVTAWSGWLNAMHEHGGGGPLEIEGHRWVGIAAAAVALMAMASVLAASWRVTETGMRVYRALVVLAAMLMGVAGHMGGSLVYGGDYLFSPLRRALGWERAETHAGTTPVAPEDAGPPVDFAAEVWPILESTCIDCHGDVRKRGQLRLDSLAAALKGGKTGPGVVKGDPGASHVIRRVKGLDGKVIMPEDADPLTPEQIEVLERWVRQGAVWPETLGAADTSVEERHWAYEPLAEVRGAAGEGVIDRLIGARLSAEGVSPAGRAEPGVLLRRLSLDMTGLPPATKELDAFERSPTGEAWSKAEAAAIEEWIVAAGEVWEDHPKRAAPRDLNGEKLESEGDPEIRTRMSQYELAFRMQASVPELMDIGGEPAAVHETYGTTPGKASFANNCLLARRLVERGVRFVQLYHWGWDSHGTGSGDDLVTSLKQRCVETDRASAALVMDLKQRGLLEDTLVVWGGEFGRTPMNEARNGSTFLGRDHHPKCFSIWMAGGGVKKGTVYGSTDELGYNVATDPVHMHDLQATILHLLGMDHTKLTYRYQGRNFRLTDVFGSVVPGLLA